MKSSQAVSCVQCRFSVQCFRDCPCLQHQRLMWWLSYSHAEFMQCYLSTSPLYAIERTATKVVCLSGVLSHLRLCIIIGRVSYHNPCSLSLVLPYNFLWLLSCVLLCSCTVLMLNLTKNLLILLVVVCIHNSVAALHSTTHCQSDFSLGLKA